MAKLGRFPVLNCGNSEMKPVAVFQEDDGLSTGDTFCSFIQHFPDLELKKTADGVRITCRENCRERKT